MQCTIMENTLIKLTLHDETKKRAHDSQIVRAKENLKLSHWRAIKEKSKVANRELVDHQACSLMQYINVIANLFKIGIYFNELR